MAGDQESSGKLPEDQDRDFADLFAGGYFRSAEQYGPVVAENGPFVISRFPLFSSLKTFFAERSAMSSLDHVGQLVAENNFDHPVHIVYPGLLRRKAERLVNAFPGKVLYAVKCNEDSRVLDALYQGGIRHFDTASIHEIEVVTSRFSDASCYYMNPVKSYDAIDRSYNEFGLRSYSLDHEAEFKKFCELIAPVDRSDVRLLVRLDLPRQMATMDLGGKFGATPDRAARLLGLIRQAGFQTGICFHVGSHCLQPEAFRHALMLARDIEEASNAPLDVIDCGGGFPVSYTGSEPEFEEFVTEIKSVTAELKFKGDAEYWCEPGRALCAEGQSIITRIDLRREDDLFLNDGVFGGLSELKYLGAHFPMRVLRSDGNIRTSEMREYQLFGPTCDNVDSCPGPFLLPEDVETGDYLEVGMIGAYSNAYRTRFNGFFSDTFMCLESDPFWRAPSTEQQVA